MRKDASDFAKDRYSSSYSDNRLVQENFYLITSFIQESDGKHIPSKTSRSTSSVPFITPELRVKIRRRIRTHAKAKKAANRKFRSLRRDIKVVLKKQHNLYVNNLVGDIKVNPKDFYQYINSQQKDSQGIPPLKRRNGSGLAESALEQADEFNGQFTDMFNKSEHTQVPLPNRSALFMEDINISAEEVTKLLKGLNLSKALGTDELHPSLKRTCVRIRSNVSSPLPTIY